MITINIPLVTLEHVKKHVRPIDDTTDDELNLKALIATQIVALHCKITSVPPSWFYDVQSPPIDIDAEFMPSYIDSTQSPAVLEYLVVPGPIQAAILLMVAELFENKESSTSQPLSPFVLALLEGFREPTVE